MQTICAIYLLLLTLQVKINNETNKTQILWTEKNYILRHSNSMWGRSNPIRQPMHARCLSTKQQVMCSATRSTLPTVSRFATREISMAVSPIQPKEYLRSASQPSKVVWLPSLWLRVPLPQPMRCRISHATATTLSLPTTSMAALSI